jgi:hypothetical protein
LTMRPYFLWVVAGCCQNGVGCHTNYRKNIEPKGPVIIYGRGGGIFSFLNF